MDPRQQAQLPPGLTPQQLANLRVLQAQQQALAAQQQTLTQQQLGKRPAPTAAPPQQSPMIRNGAVAGAPPVAMPAAGRATVAQQQQLLQAGRGADLASTAAGVPQRAVPVAGAPTAVSAATAAALAASRVAPAAVGGAVGGGSSAFAPAHAAAAPIVTHPPAAATAGAGSLAAQLPPAPVTMPTHPAVAVAAAPTAPAAAAGSGSSNTTQCTLKSVQIIKQLIPFRELMVQLQTHFASHAKLRARVDTGLSLLPQPGEQFRPTYTEYDLLALRVCELLILSCLKSPIEKMHATTIEDQGPERAYTERRKFWSRNEFRAVVRYLRDHNQHFVTKNPMLDNLILLIDSNNPDSNQVYRMKDYEGGLLEVLKARIQDLQNMVGAADRAQPAATALQQQPQQQQQQQQPHQSQQQQPQQAYPQQQQAHVVAAGGAPMSVARAPAAVALQPSGAVPVGTMGNVTFSVLPGSGARAAAAPATAAAVPVAAAAGTVAGGGSAAPLAQLHALAQGSQTNPVVIASAGS